MNLLITISILLKGNLKAAQLLIENGANVSALNYKRRSALFEAADRRMLIALYNIKRCDIKTLKRDLHQIFL